MALHHEKLQYKILAKYYLIERKKRRKTWCGNTVAGSGKGPNLRASKALFPGVHFPLFTLNIYYLVFLHPCNQFLSVGIILWIHTFNSLVLWLGEFTKPESSTWMKSQVERGEERGSSRPSGGSPGGKDSWRTSPTTGPRKEWVSNILNTVSK